MDKVTSKQIRALWGYARLLKISEETLRGWVYSRTRKSSIRDLTAREASRLINEMVRQSQPHRVGPLPLDQITPAQARWIGVLQEKISWDERRTLGLARKMYQVKGLYDLDRREASGMIEALKAIWRRVSQEKAA